jgi:hypothetical protein
MRDKPIARVRLFRQVAFSIFCRSFSIARSSKSSRFFNSSTFAFAAFNSETNCVLRSFIGSTDALLRRYKLDVSICGTRILRVVHGWDAHATLQTELVMGVGHFCVNRQ